MDRCITFQRPLDVARPVPPKVRKSQPSSWVMISFLVGLYQALDAFARAHFGRTVPQPWLTITNLAILVDCLFHTPNDCLRSYSGVDVRQTSLTTALLTRCHLALYCWLWKFWEWFFTRYKIDPAIGLRRCSRIWAPSFSQALTWSYTLCSLPYTRDQDCRTWPPAVLLQGEHLQASGFSEFCILLGRASKQPPCTNTCRFACLSQCCLQTWVSTISVRLQNLVQSACLWEATWGICSVELLSALVISDVLSERLNAGSQPGRSLVRQWISRRWKGGQLATVICCNDWEKIEHSTILLYLAMHIKSCLGLSACKGEVAGSFYL